MHPGLGPQCEGCDQQVAISSQSVRVHFSFRDSPFWAWPVSTSHGTALQAPFIPEIPARLSDFTGPALAFDFLCTACIFAFSFMEVVLSKNGTVEIPWH